MRIRKETKETLEKSGINIGDSVRSYLEELAWKTQSKKKFGELARLIEKGVKPSPKGFAVSSIREDRDRVH